MSEENLKDLLEDARLSPLLEAKVTCRARTELARKRLPLATCTESVDDARQDNSVRNPWATSLWLRNWLGEERLDLAPEGVRDVGKLWVHPEL